MVEQIVRKYSTAETAKNSTSTDTNTHGSSKRSDNHNATTRRSPEESTTASDSAQRQLHDHPIFVLFPHSPHFPPRSEAPKSRDNQQFFPDNLFLGLPAQHMEPGAQPQRRPTTRSATATPEAVRQHKQGSIDRPNRN